jgi:hypothetical protein
MQPETQVGIPSTSLITHWILITCYYNSLKSPATGGPITPNERRLGTQRVNCPPGARKSCAFVIPDAFPSGMRLALPFESTPSQTQQRWVDSPTCPLLANNYASPPSSIMPPLAHLHLSAHRCGVWNPPFSPRPNSCWGYRHETIEAINLSNWPVEAQSAESLAVQETNPLCPPPKRPERKPRHALTPGVILPSRREGRRRGQPLRGSTYMSLRGRESGPDAYPPSPQ